ncbi:MAG: amidophosphoribosyltransferase, partial [Thiomonas sp. 20-64-5]
PTASELVAHNRNIEEIRQIIGADVLIYQDLDAMKRVIREINPAIAEFEASCFDGCYIAGTLPKDEGRNRAADYVEPNTGRLSLQGAEEQGQAT